MKTVFIKKIETIELDFRIKSNNYKNRQKRFENHVKIFKTKILKLF